MTDRKYDLSAGALPIGIVISVVLSVIGGTAVAVKTMVDVSNQIEALRSDMNYKFEVIRHEQADAWTRSQMQAWAWELKAKNQTVEVPEIAPK